jgi:hypothetical protein
MAGRESLILRGMVADLRYRLKIQADIEGKTVQELVIELIEKYLKEKEREGDKTK